MANLKTKFDASVSKDGATSKAYNEILHTCLGKIMEDMRRADPTFARLCRGDVYYGGSYFDGLAVGNLRHEFDLDVIFRVGIDFTVTELFLLFQGY